MSKLPKELLREYVRSQNFTSTEEVLETMKEMFKDVVQEVLEAEMDSHLGYDKYEVS
jgi:transposase-like protein